MKIKHLFIVFFLPVLGLSGCKKNETTNNNVPVGTASIIFQGATYTYDSLTTAFLNEQVGGGYQTYFPVSNSSATADFAIYGQVANGNNTIDSTGYAGSGTTAGQVGLVFTLAAGANGSAMSVVYYGNSGTVQLNGTIITVNAIVENISTGAKYPLTGTFNF